MPNRMIKKLIKHFTPLTAAFLSACTLVQYQPLAGISAIDTNKGYRLEKNWEVRNNDDIYMIMVFSGGGTRAAALGYGVLEELGKQKVWFDGKERTLLESVDLVYGVSGGSVLAAYFSLHGKDVIPAFERRFLKQNFQRQITKQAFSLANLPRLTSPEYGRGDLLQEQFENTLFRNATFGDLEKRRKGPFAVISATDMSTGQRFDFTQEYFDSMCLNLSELRIARAVAASSSVPLVFAPVTLNNNGGNCGYTLPKPLRQALESADKDSLRTLNRKEISNIFERYNNSNARPYIHLIDGGLTDNLGLRGLLDIAEAYSDKNLYQRVIEEKGARKVILINVNAQNQIDTQIDQSPNIPGVSDVLNAIINIPIDQYSQESLRRVRSFADQWNDTARNDSDGRHKGMYFISLNLRDLPESELRKSVLNIPTSFYLPHDDINKLKHAARELLAASPEYARLLKALSADPTEHKQIWFPDDPEEDKQTNSADTKYDGLLKKQVKP
ncbi:patatin [Neisseria canis]|nr:patatin [Neisseria canis]